MKNPDAPAVKREAEEDWGRDRWRGIGDIHYHPPLASRALHPSASLVRPASLQPDRLSGRFCFWPKKCIEPTRPRGRSCTSHTSCRSKPLRASWLHFCEAPLSETIHDSSCWSIGLARGHRDGDDQCAWTGHRLPCRGWPPSHDTNHVVRAHGCSAMPTPRAQQRCVRVTSDAQAEAAARQASILPANKSGSCSRT
jgi:hypothetical protein